MIVFMILLIGLNIYAMKGEGPRVPKKVGAANAHPPRPKKRIELRGSNRSIESHSGMGMEGYDDEQAIKEDTDGSCFRTSGVDNWCWISRSDELVKVWKFIDQTRFERAEASKKISADKFDPITSDPPEEFLKYHIRVKPIGAKNVIGTVPGWQLLVKHSAVGTSGQSSITYCVMTFPWEPSSEEGYENGYFVDHCVLGKRSPPGWIQDRPWRLPQA